MPGDITPFSTATEMLRALEAREISSQELTELHIDRIEQHNAPLNAIVVETFDRAREAARHADEERQHNGAGALLGLPMTLKESTLTAGLPQSAGLKDFAEYRPSTDGPLARAVFDAGACLLGKTNIPVALGDWQSDSPVYGRTNNPWDTSRTPGGSTGGGGAALAAGLTPLEVGSDIGGSIRVPAAYCGVYGHKPSETAIPQSGAFPLADLPNPAALMGVQGPLARSAEDLETLFWVLSGPDVGEDTAWQLLLPPARATTFEELRVAVLPAQGDIPVAGELQGRVDELASLLAQRGATVAETPLPFDRDDYFYDYIRLLHAMTTVGSPRDVRERQAADLRKRGDRLGEAMAEGRTMDVPAFSQLLKRREEARELWRGFFRDWDVMLAPMTLDAAFPHQDAPFMERVLNVDGQEVPYIWNIFYPMLALFAGQPSTAFPAGRNGAGLPLGLQVIGPYLEDRTTLEFAKMVEREWYAFEAPPGY
ncbi:MAG: amidase family protein [Dehalococcoidia bacterium]|nr:amidase family protein [Dehalococcoidia bacterium]